MFDTFPPKIPDRDITVAMRLRRLRDERIGYLKHIVTAASIAAAIDARCWPRAEEIAARGGVVPVELRDMHVQHSFVRAADKYVLRPWDGHVVLMRAEEAGFEAQGLGDGVRLGRGRRRAASTSSQVPGNHDTLVLEPNATTLVQQLRVDARPHPGRALDRRTADRRTAADGRATDRRTADRRSADRRPTADR